MRCSTISCLLLGLLVLVGGCAKRLQATNLPQLELGKTTGAQVRAIFGNPDHYDTRTSNGRVSQILSYSHFNGSGFLVWKAIDERVLLVELINSNLHGYIFAGSQGDNATKIDPAAQQRVVKGTRREEVLKLMGPPAGKALRDSRITDYEGLFAPGVTEVWAWTNIAGANGTVFENHRFRSFFVKFDATGRVVGTGSEDVTISSFSGRMTRNRNVDK